MPQCLPHTQHSPPHTAADGRHGNAFSTTRLSSQLNYSVPKRALSSSKQTPQQWITEIKTPTGFISVKYKSHTMTSLDSSGHLKVICAESSSATPSIYTKLLKCQQEISRWAGLSVRQDRGNEPKKHSCCSLLTTLITHITSSRCQRAVLSPLISWHLKK